MADDDSVNDDHDLNDDDNLSDEGLDDLINRLDDAGIDTDRTFLWDVNPSDILYLFNQYPFLQIVDTRVEVDPPAAPDFLVAERSGWTIYDYGNAMSSARGLMLYGGGDFTIPEDPSQKSGAVVNAGKGTVVNQAYETAIEMVRIADERGWEGLLIVDGHPMMQWAAWVEAYDRGFIIEGYEPTDLDFDKRYRIRRKKEEDEELRAKVQQRLKSQGMSK